MGYWYIVDNAFVDDDGGGGGGGGGDDNDDDDDDDDDDDNDDDDDDDDDDNNDDNNNNNCNDLYLRPIHVLFTVTSRLARISRVAACFPQALSRNLKVLRVLGGLVC